ncbi:MAG TPA: alpha/beta hydrolase family protein [Euzebyales bacterium]
MAHLRCDFFSDALSLSTSMTVLLPQPTTSQVGMEGAAVDGDPPVLYLLHGLSDDDTTWLRRTSIERYVAALGLAVVMPQVHRSFYLDGVHTGSYWTFISDELPEIVHRFFRVSERREDTFVAGLSMGGYGAFRLALHQPERFAAAASLSGALDLASLQGLSERERLMAAVFGERTVADTDDDLIDVVARVDPDALPALYVACGTEDHLYEHNRAFVAAAARNRVACTYTFGPGEHAWDYWDATICDVLDWLPLQRSAVPA